jgi:hypothetical protein
MGAPDRQPPDRTGVRGLVPRRIEDLLDADLRDLDEAARP